MDIFQINNNQIQLSVKQQGAEICSLKSVLSGKEYIWDGNPEIWAYHSPVLFPIVGALKNDVFKYKEQEYSLPQHGFMRLNKNVKLIEKNDSSLTFCLSSSEATLMVYPFDFEFIIRYRIFENTVIVEHEVINASEGDMYFSLGAHPAFKCPVNKDETYSDYFLEFEQNEHSKTYEVVGSLIGKSSEDIFNGKNIIGLHPNIFNKGALVFKDLKSAFVCLKSKKSAQYIKVQFKGFPFMGIWAKPNANFVCIEPWLGIADSVDTNQDFTTKEGIIKLSKNKTFKTGYSIQLVD